MITSSVESDKVVDYLKSNPGYYVSYSLIAGACGIDREFKIWHVLDQLVKEGKIFQHPGGHPNYSTCKPIED